MSTSQQWYCAVLKFIIKLTLTLLTAVSFFVYSKNSNETLSFGHSFNFTSQLLKEERTVYVHLPKSYTQSPSATYPLYLTFDARSMFHPAASFAESLSSAEMLPEMIVVSIKNTNRWRDLTPKLPNVTMEPGTGGGDVFFEFIENELLPKLKQRYRISEFKVLSGHSFGGLMVFDALTRKPNLFDAYVAISPAISWINDELFDLYKIALADAKNPLLYIVNADEQYDVPRLTEIKRLLAPDKSSIINYKFDDLSETENHHSVRTIGELNGMKWIFRHYQLPSKTIYQLTDKAIDEHFRYASALYKMDLQFDVMQMTNAAYWGLSSPEHQQRALSLFNLAVNKWPENAYAWSCLAEAHERIGNIKEALKYANLAVELGKKHNFADMYYLTSIQARIQASL